AVDDGVLDERLEEQRRHEAILPRRVDLLFDREPLAEPDPLDFQVAFRQRHLLGDRNAGLLADRQTLAQEVAELHAHLPSSRRVAPRERGNGVEAIEEEVRLDLRLESLQLRLAGQERLRRLPALGLAGGLEREKDVVQRDREEVEQDSDRKEREKLRGIPVRDAGEIRNEGEQPHDPRAEGDPGRAGHEGRRGVRHGENRDSPPRQRKAAAGIRGRQAQERENQGERESQRRRFADRIRRGPSQQRRQDRGQRNRRREIRQQPPFSREDRMHGGLVLDLDSSHDRDTLDDQG